MSFDELDEKTQKVIIKKIEEIINEEKHENQMVNETIAPRIAPILRNEKKSLKLLRLGEMQI